MIIREVDLIRGRNDVIGIYETDIDVKDYEIEVEWRYRQGDWDISVDGLSMGVLTQESNINGSDVPQIRYWFVSIGEDDMMYIAENPLDLHYMFPNIPKAEFQRHNY